MDGNNFSVRGYISLTIVIIISLLGLLATITSSDQKEPGKEEEKRLQQQSAAKLLMHQMEMPLKYGEMESKPVPSSLLMNASKLLIE